MTHAPLGPTRSQILASRIHPWLQRHREWAIPLASGYLLGRVVNATSGQLGSDFSALTRELFGISPEVNALSWLAFLVLIGVPLAEKWIRFQRYELRGVALFDYLAGRRVHPAITSYARSSFAWDNALTLQMAPDLQRGWPLNTVEIRVDGTPFPFPTHLRADYERFIGENRERLRLDQDNPKYALAKNPSSFSDMPTLLLEIQATKYSEALYYANCVANIATERDRLIDDAVNRRTIGFPHRFCMHAIVTTRDQRLLLTKRSVKVAYARNGWSLSVEEQLTPADMSPAPTGAATRWATRLLLEELAVGPDSYDPSAFRALSVFLEVDELNCAICTVLPLDLSSKELEQILRVTPRTDYEFNEWCFLTYEDIAIEVRQPTRVLHPSTSYRAILALANRFGAARLPEVLFGRIRGA